VPALAHELARLIGPFHGEFSAARGTMPDVSGDGAAARALCGRRASDAGIGAAYRGSGPLSSMRSGDRPGPVRSIFPLSYQWHTAHCRAGRSGRRRVRPAPAGGNDGGGGGKGSSTRSVVPARSPHLPFSCRSAVIMVSRRRRDPALRTTEKHKPMHGPGLTPPWLRRIIGGPQRLGRVSWTR
jgi:hypothetical protein